MGCPSIYFEEVLQNFAYNLTCMEDMKLAKELFEEKDVVKLKNYILEKKETIPIEKFYYNAGMASMHVLNRCDEEDGNDGFNACCGGLYSFERFIGVRKEDKNEG